MELVIVDDAPRERQEAEGGSEAEERELAGDGARVCGERGGRSIDGLVVVHAARCDVLAALRAAGVFGGGTRGGASLCPWLSSLRPPA
jgi:hypothetical protein